MQGSLGQYAWRLQHSRKDLLRLKRVVLHILFIAVVFLMKQDTWHKATNHAAQHYRVNIYKQGFCREYMTKRGRKGQVTIFVIIAIIIVASLLLYFLFQRKPEVQRADFADPKKFIESCVQDSAQEAVNILLPQGGYISPEQVPKKYKLYEDNKVVYLCYTKSYYETCTTQEPLYIQHLEQEINDYIQPKIAECFFQLKQDLEKRNYEVVEKDLKTEVSLEPKRIRIDVQKPLTLRKNEETQEFSSFPAGVSSPLYDLAVVAQEIASQETRFCDFEYVGYMVLHKEFDIEKKAVGGGEDASKIYIIGDRATGKKLYTAIRSCAIPPGF